MLHGVRIRQLPDHTAGIAGGEAVIGNGTGDHTAGTDDAAVADGDAGQDRHIGADPAIVAHMHGLCVTQPPGRAVSAHQKSALAGQHGMQRRDDL